MQYEEEGIVSTIRFIYLKEIRFWSFLLAIHAIIIASIYLCLVKI